MIGADSTQCVLGIDLALKSWASVGQAMIVIDAGDRPRWRRVTFDAMQWPSGAVTAAALADAIVATVQRYGVTAVAIDGPHAWRHPDPAACPSPFARAAESAVKAQGKTGVFGACLPRTMIRWVKLSIELFDRLIDAGGVLASSTNKPAATPGAFLLLETYPTATWRESGLAPLPSRRRAGASQVWQWSGQLRNCFGLPESASVDHHDNLQALVAAIAAAGLVGGPAEVRRHGQPEAIQPATAATPSHRIEGFIWTASPVGELVNACGADESVRECFPAKRPTRTS